jgi:hypothetical protein
MTQVQRVKMMLSIVSHCVADKTLRAQMTSDLYELLDAAERRAA